MLSQFVQDEAALRCIERVYCGLSPDIVDRMYCVILEAYLDDSETDERYILAGFVAPMDEWRAINKPWFDLLKQRPRLGFYRTYDAISLTGQFQHFDAAARDKRIAELAHSLSDQPNPQIVGVASWISKAEFADLCEPVFHPAWHDPYYVCAISIIAHICRDWMPLRPSRMDFFFDRQGKVGTQFKAVFDAGIRPLGLGFLFPFLGDVRHENKKDFLPLQAADMQAGWIRRKNSTIQVWTSADTHLARIQQRYYPIPRQALEYANNFGTDNREKIASAWEEYLKKQTGESK